MSEMEQMTREIQTDPVTAQTVFSPAPDSSLPMVTPPAGQTLINVEGGVISAQKVAVPRDKKKVMQELKTLAAAAGESWYYGFPVKNRKTGQTDIIEGPTIKLANDLAREYGNCQIDLRAIDQGETWVFYARFVDVETGYSLTRAFQQDKQASKLGGEAARRLDIAFQIGQSKAIRNVVVNALQTFADFCFEEAKNNLVTKVGRNLDQYRQKIVTRFHDMDIALKRVEAVHGRVAKDWTARDVAKIISEIQAISDGMVVVSDLYPDVAATGEAAERPTRSETTGNGQDQTAPEGSQSPAGEPEAPAPQDSDQTTGQAQAPTPEAREYAFVDHLGEETAVAHAGQFADSVEGHMKAVVSLADLSTLWLNNVTALARLQAEQTEWYGELHARYQERVKELGQAAQQANNGNGRPDPAANQAPPAAPPAPAAIAVALMNERGQQIGTHTNLKAFYDGLRVVVGSAQNKNQALLANYPGHMKWVGFSEGPANSAWKGIEALVPAAEGAPAQGNMGV